MNDRYEELRQRVEDHLNRVTAQEWEEIPHPLRDAMAYSLLSGGKRLRPVLLLAAHELIAPADETALRFAGALEMIHTYSLIHDDLPAMDNDTLRRGKPTCHVVYGEGMAVLAGDGLLSLAMEEMLSCPHERALSAARFIVQAAGVRGMVAGQCLDLAHEGEPPAQDLVTSIHRLKTGCLLTAPMEAGLCLAGAGEKQLTAGRTFGQLFGTAFQIQDDLLDLHGNEQDLGKHIGKDLTEGKMTWPALVGAEQAQKDVEYLTEQACAALEATFGEASAFLCSLARSCTGRIR